MGKPVINYFTEETSYVLKDKRKIKAWVAAAIDAEGYTLDELNFIFCGDEYLLRINQEYLNHDTFTDVITFDNAEATKTITGDIFISIDRIRENAALYGHAMKAELCRVMIHGTLHLLGYKDKSRSDKKQMTDKEDEYLSRLHI